MKLTILGSSSASPNPTRTSPGYILEVGKDQILLDSGSGVAQKIIQAKYDLLKIRYFFYTHTHADHVTDLPYILFTSRWKYRKMPLTILGPKKFKNFFSIIEKTFAPRLRKYKVNVVEMTNAEKKFLGFKVVTKKMSHSGKMFVPYAIGYRIESKNKVFVYAGDTAYCKNLIELAKDADCLLIEGGIPENSKKTGHFKPSDATKIAENAGVKKLVLTHFSLEADNYDMKKQAKKYFKGPIILAKDLMKINIWPDSEPVNIK
ncbi:MBL fold metallo-hydrolase [Patescibacteria group bacterium]|nr:MBL fold metallo-hydrolase [Patescibacteria group bacterium]